MENWNEVINIKKIVDIFGEPITFHDANVVNIKYDGKNGSIEINCEDFIKTMCLFDEKYKKYKNIIVEICFKDVNLFQIDGGYGFIDELILEKDGNNLVASINSCGLKFICDSIEINNISVINKQDEKHNKLLDKFLKSNL